MLAVETSQPPPLLRKKSLFRRFSKRERPLEISSPIIGDMFEPQSPPSPRSPRKLQRRSTERQLERIPETPPSLPALNTKPIWNQTTFIKHIRVDSAGSFSSLPISQQFSRPPPSPPATPPRSSEDSTHSRVPRSAHPTSPFPHNTRIGTWDLFLPPPHAHALYTGVAPAAPAHEWFIFSEGPDVNGKLKVHFHRASSGVKVAELFVVLDLKGEGAGKVVGVKWNASEQTQGMGEERAKREVRGACRVALGIELEGGEF